MSDPNLDGLSEVKNGVGEANPPSSVNQNEVNTISVKQEQNTVCESMLDIFFEESFLTVFRWTQ